MSSRVIDWWLAAAVVCAAVTVACNSAGSGSGHSTATKTPPPEEALRIYVQRLGQDFVQNCADAERPFDVGKQCATFLGERTGMRAYALGPTFSEPTRVIILNQVDGIWTIAHLETHDPNAGDIPGVPWPLEIGATVVIAGTGDCLRVRERPGTDAAEVDCLKDGTSVTIVEGPVPANDIEWWKVGDIGWAAGTYLRYADDDITPAPTDG